MIHIRKFMDKMAVMEAKQSKDVVLPIIDARGLRDDIAKLLSDLYELTNAKLEEKDNSVIEVQIKGGGFK
jgi:ABC-type transporter lipoprotein component MlaA